MTNPPDGHEFQARLRRLEGLIREVERFPDPAARECARGIVQAVLDLHAAALDRLLGHVADAGDAGRAVLGACAADDLVGGLLLLHGLHPVGLEDRVRRALDRVRPRLRHYGGGVELLGVEDGVVRLRLRGGDDGPADAVRGLIEDVLTADAPDAAGVEFEGEPAADGRPRVALPIV